jgi:hypothetical protein
MLTTLSILSFDQGPKFELKLRSDIPEHLFEAPEPKRRVPPSSRKPER